VSAQRVFDAPAGARVPEWVDTLMRGVLLSSRGLAVLGAALALASCAAAEPGVKEVRAPIVRVTLRVAESHPPQYFADVVSALPDGCTHFARFAVRRENASVLVDVFNTVPSDPATMCTMIYGEKESAVPLGSDFEPGRAYTLDVNGARQPFLAQ
jgi:hypothetical protein